uniref:Small ribosomal subunit protein uS13m n=2 Tax=Teucrium TaxID=21896 RepID=A0A6M8E4U3_9LAMI|nr:ribosomal protein S13 [Teucrium simplex]QKE23580.1 ribosomal protein S13 [Teucrium omeiense]
MFSISRTRLVTDKQVRIASTKIYGIGLKKSIQLRYRLGIRGNIKFKELTKYQIYQIEEILGQEHVVHWELERREGADIKRLISISCYRGIRHKKGSPLRGQRTHTNARTCRKQMQIRKIKYRSPRYLSDQSH